jgi:hypothetical protein
MSRHPAHVLRRRLDRDGEVTLTLSVAVEGMENLLLAIGSNTGWVTDKRRELGIDMCRPGGTMPANDGSAFVDTAPRLTAAERDLHALHQTLHTVSGRTNALGRRADSLARRLQCSDRSTQLSSPRDTLSRASVRVVGPAEAMDNGEVAVRASCAHIVCRVTAMTEHDGHWHTIGTVTQAHVKPAYWGGKTLRPADKTVPALLTFLGSHEFGYIHSTPS